MIGLILGSRLAQVAAAIAAVLVFYEGVPVVASVPYVDRLPLVGDLAVGRVGRARIEGGRAEAVKWQAARLEAIDRQAEMRREAQAVIDEIERDHLAREARIRAEYQQQSVDLSDAEYQCVTGDDGRHYLSDGLSRYIFGAPAGD